MEKLEVAVIGAGPAGLLAAREVAKSGISVEVFEEHALIGEPNHCAGLVSVEGLRRLGLEPHPEFVQNEVTGGIIYSPNGVSMEIRGNRTRAYVIDRTAFDRHLARIVEGEGAVINTGQRVKALNIEEGRIRGIQVSDGIINTQLVIDAEGAGGSLIAQAGLKTNKNGVLMGVNAEVSGVELEPRLVEVWLSRDLSPGLFSWVIPLGDDRARCGLACDHGNPAERLKIFLSNRFGDIECSPPRGGAVLTSGPLSKTSSAGLMVVGDAAGQTKPTTGGGVIIGGLCAIEAGSTAAEAVKAGDTSAKFLRRYQKAWKDSFEGEFKAMLTARRIANRLSDVSMDRLFEAIKREGLEEIIGGLVEGGDMDMQSGVIDASLRNPALMKAIIKAAGRVALGELKGVFNV